MIVTYTSILSESTCFIHEFIIYQSTVKMISYCSLVPRSSNDSQARLKLLRKRSLLTPESCSYAA